MIKESGVVGAGLEAEGLKALGHGDGVEVGLSLDDKSEASGGIGDGAATAHAEALPELRELALDLGGGEVGGHGVHALADPADHAPAQLPSPQRISVLVERPDADGRFLRGGKAFFPLPLSLFLLHHNHHVLTLLFIATAQQAGLRR